MNSTFLRILAVFMALAAIATAYLSYRSSHKAPVEPVKVVVPSYAQVVARHDIAPGHVLALEDLETITTQQFDAQSFNEMEPLVGKVTMTAVTQGVPFKTSDFPATHWLGQALAPNERAVAIKVNEVVGVGGFIKPGDHVDVLLYLRTERETGDVSSAQVVLTDVRVLAYGALTGETTTRAHREPAPEPAATEVAPNKLGTEVRGANAASGKDSRSAIVAVSDKDISKLMLADSTGVLRLALRGATIPDTSSTVAEITPPNNQFIRLGDISQAATTPKAAQAQAGKAATSQASAPRRAAVSKRERVIVHQGEKVEVVNVAR